MRNRPLCSVCLVLFLFMNVFIRAGGGYFFPPGFDQNEVTGQVYQKEIKEKYQILYLKNNSVTKSKIIIYDKEKKNIALGNYVRVTGSVQDFDEARNPGNFNQRLYYQKQGISAGIWASEIQMISSEKWKVRESLWNLKRSWGEDLKRVLGEEKGAILTAMLLGDKAGIDANTKELYQLNGIGHILAISGLHLSLIGIGMYKALRRMTGSYVVGGIAGIAFLLCYIILVGISVSSFRALIMFLFRVGADMFGRKYDSPTALSFSAVAALIWRPLYIYDGGFWLSFGAVFAVIFFVPVFEKRHFKSFWMSLGINLMLLPIVCFYFYEFPLYSVLINLVVIPLMPFLMVFCIIGIILKGICYPVGKMFFICAKWILIFYEQLCSFFISFPYSRIVTGIPKIWEIIFYYAVLFGVIYLCKKKEKYKYTVVIIVAGLLLFGVKTPDKGLMRITVLDVGQGDSIFIESPTGITFLVDCGSSDVGQLSKYRIEPFLKAEGIDELDYIFITHGDKDHISGIEEMIERSDRGIHIKTLVFPTTDVWNEELNSLAEKALKHKIKVKTIEAGKCLKKGEVILRCLVPEKESDLEPGNEASLVLSLEYKEFDMLLTGDVEGEGEEKLMKILEEDYREKTWEVLKAAHHGSKNSSKEEFLSVVKPKYAIISAGQDNSYGHPHKETLMRFEKYGCSVYSTKENGAVGIVTNGEKMYFKLNSH